MKLVGTTSHELLDATPTPIVEALLRIDPHYDPWLTSHANKNQGAMARNAYNYLAFDATCPISVQDYFGPGCNPGFSTPRQAYSIVRSALARILPFRTMALVTRDGRTTEEFTTLATGAAIARDLAGVLAGKYPELAKIPGNSRR